MVSFRLIPREAKFFDDFLVMTDQIQAGARLLEKMLVSDPPALEIVSEIKEVEHKCDFLTHEIVQRLNRTFVTPLDREDIHTLALSLDDIMDAIDAAAALFRTYRIQTIRPGAREITRLLTESCAEVRLAVKALEARTDAVAHAIRINDLDNIPIVSGLAIFNHVRTHAIECHGLTIRAQRTHLLPQVGRHGGEPAAAILLERNVVA